MHRNTITFLSPTVCFEMGTGVLLSKNCNQDRVLRGTVTRSPPLRSRRRPHADSSSSHPESTHADSRRQRRSTVGLQSGDHQLQSQSLVVKFPAKNLVMGQVKILKRGETLSIHAEEKNHQSRDNRNQRFKSQGDFDLTLGPTTRLGPAPEMVQRRSKVNKGSEVAGGGYAGSGFCSSPHPSLLPVPGFLGKVVRAP